MIALDHTETLVGIAEIAIALAGFSGVVVVFGSRSSGQWDPGDRLRLTFLLEAGFTAGGFALATLALLSLPIESALVWAIVSGSWAVFMCGSLYSSSRRMRTNRNNHGDVDDVSNRIVFLAFAILIVIQLANVVLWQVFTPVLLGLLLNLIGAALQFGRLIQSAFRD